MDYELLSIDPEAVGRMHILIGTVVKTTIKDNTVNVDIDEYGMFEGIPVFYHCPHSETARDGMPFIKNDRIAILNKGDTDSLDVENLEAIGFEDGLPRPCEFRFKIVRDDGVVIDRTKLSRLHGIKIFQQHRETETRQLAARAHGYDHDLDPEDAPYWVYKDGIWYYERETYYGLMPIVDMFSYNTETQIWTVYFVELEDVVPRRDKSFWATFLAEDTAVRVEYSYPSSDDSHPEYIYDINEFYKDSEKMFPGFYDIRVPYYNVTQTGDRNRPNDPELEALIPIGAWHSYYGANPYLTANVMSSIPYSVSFTVLSPISWCGRGIGVCGQSSKTVAEITADAIERGESLICSTWCDDAPPPMNADISPNTKVTTPAGESHPPLFESMDITPSPYNVESGTYTISLSAGNGCVACQCNDGVAVFYIPVTAMFGSFGIDTNPNT